MKGGKNVKLPDVIEMYVSDEDLKNGIDFTVYDYDYGPDPDDLLGVGKLVNLVELKKHLYEQRQYDTHLTFKGRPGGEATCLITLKYPAGEAPRVTQPIARRAVTFVVVVVLCCFLTAAAFMYAGSKSRRLHRWSSRYRQWPPPWPWKRPVSSSSSRST